ncbi:CBS domain-containing protein [Kitasatospora mediocidica]|uniref:CBS domain-containing protein n=1 Tax=Kitasatospora mediocidica TaxID=58352 RepID=UPI0012F84821|nr:CBS domain-containing protein [Kitasatospora mediocidica]
MSRQSNGRTRPTDSTESLKTRHYRADEPSSPPSELPHRTRVSEVMSRQVVAVDPRAGFAVVVSALQEHHHDMLPVVDRERHVMGMVCASDLLTKLAVQALPARAMLWESRNARTIRRKAAGVEAGELMSTPVVTVGERTTVEQAALLALRHRVHHLPVVDSQRRLTGIVCLCDLLKVLRRDDAAVRAEVEVVALAPDLGTVASTLRVGCVHGRVALEARTVHHHQADQLLHRVRAVEGVVSVADDLRWEIEDEGLAGPQT